MNLSSFHDPFKLKALLWPEVTFYDKQCEIIESVFYDAYETYVPAGNQLGKDFVAGFICLAFFLRSIVKKRTCRIVTTSVAEHHLTVLWGEIGRFLKTSRYPLIDSEGGPLHVNYMEIRRKEEMYVKTPINYLVGRVSAKGEGLAGHHAEDTLFCVDEASGVDDESYRMAQGWAKRMLIFGNPNPTANFFYKAVKAGNLLVAENKLVG